MNAVCTFGCWTPPAPPSPNPDPEFGVFPIGVSIEFESDMPSISGLLVLSAFDSEVLSGGICWPASPEKGVLEFSSFGSCCSIRSESVKLVPVLRLLLGDRISSTVCNPGRAMVDRPFLMTEGLNNVVVAVDRMTTNEKKDLDGSIDDPKTFLLQ